MSLNIDLLEMDRNELVALSKKVSKVLDDYDARQKVKARAAVEAIAREHGYSLTDLVAADGRKGSKAAPKYAHPENPTKTWTGRGRKPKWVEEHLAAGGDLSDLAISA